MKSFPYLFFFALSTLLLTNGCQRVTDDQPTSLSIHIPGPSKLKTMLQSGSSIDINKLCFGVNIKGPGILVKEAQTCRIEKGLTAGTVKAGEILSVNAVPAGPDRTIEVYGFLMESTNQTCPSTFSDDSANWPANKIFLLASRSKLQFSPPEVSVDLTLSIPNTTDHIAALYGWPQTCSGGPATTGPIRGRMMIGSKNLVSTSFKIQAKVAEQKTEFELYQGGTYKFRGSVR